MLLNVFISAFICALHSLVVVAKTSSTQLFPQYPNATAAALITAPTGSSQSSCCFVVQTEFIENYWPGNIITTYGLTTISNQLSITSIVIYSDTTVTSHQLLVSTTIVKTSSIAPPNSLNNIAARRPSVNANLLNGSLVETAGTVITSPAMFYVYSSVYIITVPAVTLNNGQLACATRSFHPEVTRGVTAFGCQNNTNCSYSSTVVTADTVTFTINSHLAHLMDDAGSPHDFQNQHLQEMISFPTPFIYVPVAGATENYGYIPQTLVEWMSQDSHYLTQHPGLASCLPGGPGITIALENRTLRYAMPFKINPQSALTLNTIVTVTSAGCFAPAACSISGSASPAPGSIALPPSLASASGATSTAALVEDLPGKISSRFSLSTDTGVALPLASTMTSKALSSSALSPQVTAPTTTAVISLSEAKSVITIGSSMISANLASQPLTAGQTLVPGRTPITVSGSRLSLALSDTAFIVNGAIPPQSTAKAQGLGAAIASFLGIPPPVMIGSESITANSASQYIVGSQTMIPGAAPIVVSGSTYSLAPSATAVNENGTPTPLQRIEKPSVSAFAVAPVITFGSVFFTADSASQYIIGSQTLIPGAPAIVISGESVSLAPSANDVVIDGSTLQLSSAFDYIVGSQTIVPGAPQITVSGLEVSLAPSGNAVVIAGSTIPLAAEAAPVVTLGSQLITANAASQYLIGSQTLVPGAAITVSGTIISLALSANDLVVVGSTIATAMGAAPVITFGSQLITANAASHYLIGGQTLMPGAAITVSGTVISLAPSADDLVVGGSTIVLTAGTAPVITIGSQLITANAASQYRVGSQTLIPGAAITVSGTIISLAPYASDLVVGGSTVVLSKESDAAGGPTSKGNPLYTNPEFTAEGTRIGLGLMGEMLGLGLGLFVLLLL